jgi:hypothetical protein
MKRGTPRHPKLGDLMEALQIKERALAVGYLELLWHFAAEFAPQGDIGKYSDSRIEAAMDWHGKRGRLVEALTTSRWLDVHDKCRLCVHDWADHADESVRKRLQRANVNFVVVTGKVTGQNFPSSANLEGQNPPALALALPLPKPQANGACAVLAPIKTPPDPIANRFSFWFSAYRGQKSDEAGALRMWLSWQKTLEQCDAADACSARYSASAIVARGEALMEARNFIDQQARNRWRGTWAPPASKVAPQKMGVAQSVEALVRQRIARGQDPL